MRALFIMHYFEMKKNGLQGGYFLNNGLQSASVKRSFLYISHKMVQILQQ